MWCGVCGVDLFRLCCFGHLAASRESAAGTETRAGTGTPSEEKRGGPTCAHLYSLMHPPPHTTPGKQVDEED